MSQPVFWDNPDKAKEVLGADTKTAMAELDDRAGLQKGLAGAKRVSGSFHLNRVASQGHANVDKDVVGCPNGRAGNG